MAAGLLTFPLHSVLVPLISDRAWLDWVRSGGALGGVALVFVVYMAGVLFDLRRRIRWETSANLWAQEVLRIDQSEMERRVAEHTVQSGYVVEPSSPAHDPAGASRLGKRFFVDALIIFAVAVFLSVLTVALDAHERFDEWARSRENLAVDEALFVVAILSIVLGAFFFLRWGDLAREFTKRAHAEEALLRSEELYRAVAEGMSDGVSINVDDKRMYVNQAFVDIHGLSDASEAVGKPIEFFFSPEDQGFFKEYFESRGTASALPIGDRKIIRPDGVVRNVETNVSAITYRGEPARLVVLRDTIYRKQAEAALEATRASLVQAEKLSAIGTLVAGVAHEVNNPLAGALGRVELMLRRDPDEALKRDLQIIHDETMRAVRIMRNLLSFAREHNPEKTLVDVNEVIESTLALRAYEMRVNNVELETELQPDLPMTMADPHELQQVFLNLITNAEQAIGESQDRGVVSVKTSRSVGTFNVTIEDDGPGIPAEIIARIFDPFFTTKAEGKGTGLGLSISYGIIQEHGGDMHVESQVGRGTTMTIQLPIAAEDSPNP